MEAAPGERSRRTARWWRNRATEMKPASLHIAKHDTKGIYALQPPVSRDEKDCATVWGDFVEGLARWKFGSKYGFIDRSGKVIIKPQFDLTFQFSEGLAAIQIKGKWGYIDKT